MSLLYFSKNLTAKTRLCEKYTFVGSVKIITRFMIDEYLKVVLSSLVSIVFLNGKREKNNKEMSI